MFVTIGLDMIGPNEDDDTHTHMMLACEALDFKLHPTLVSDFDMPTDKAELEAYAHVILRMCVAGYITSHVASAVYVAARYLANPNYRLCTSSSGVLPLEAQQIVDLMTI